MNTNSEWLQQRLEHYWAQTNDMCEAIEDFDDLSKLGQGFTSVDPLEEVDIGDGNVPRPTYVNKNLDPEFKFELINLLREYVDCFAWNYTEMPGLSRELVEHRLPIKPGFKAYKQPARCFNPLMYDRIKAEINRFWKQDLLGLVDMLIGSLTLCQWRRKVQVNSEFALILEILIELLLKMNILCL